MSTVSDQIKVECPSCKKKLLLSKDLRLSKQNCPDCGTDFTVPEKFGEYLLLDVTANDEFSSTHHAQSLAGDNQIVIRRLRAEYIDKPDLNNLFSEEVAKLESNNEEHLVKAIATGDVNDCPYIAFEHFGVKSLKTRLLEGRPELLEGCYLMLDILSSLEQSFSQSLVHGNLKPSNLRFDEHGNIRVYDFGLSMTLIRELMKENITIGLYNNAQYISPETVARGELTPVSDIYSLGAIFYEIITGKKTFESFQDVAAMHLKLDRIPEAPNHLRPGVPPVLNQLIMSMLSIDSAKRPQFIDLVIEEVQKAIDELESQQEKEIDLESTVIADLGYSKASLDVKKVPIEKESEADLSNIQEEKLSQYSLLGVLGVCIVLLLILYFGINS